jgi:hypothetical protein
MEPEIKVVTTPERKEKDKDGKERVVKAATSTTERTGVDMRINTLKGIAALINDDLSNVAEVALMLRDEGTLGSENKALRLYRSGVDKLETGLCQLFGVTEVSEITLAMATSKCLELLGPLPDPTKPRARDRAGVLVRFGRKITPGAFPNAQKEMVHQEWTRKRVFITAITALITAAIVANITIYGLKKHQERVDLDNIINQRITTSAEEPTK